MSCGAIPVDGDGSTLKQFEPFTQGHGGVMEERVKEERVMWRSRCETLNGHNSTPSHQKMQSLKKIRILELYLMEAVPGLKARFLVGDGSLWLVWDG